MPVVWNRALLPRALSCRMGAADLGRPTRESPLLDGLQGFLLQALRSCPIRHAGVSISILRGPADSAASTARRLVRKRDVQRQGWAVLSKT